MDTQTIVMCVVALIIGMLTANMLKSVCGCKTVEGKGKGKVTCTHKGCMGGLKFYNGDVEFSTDCCKNNFNPPTKEYLVKFGYI